MKPKTPKQYTLDSKPPSVMFIFAYDMDDEGDNPRPIWLATDKLSEIEPGTTVTKYMRVATGKHEYVSTFVKKGK